MIEQDRLDQPKLAGRPYEARWFAFGPEARTATSRAEMLAYRILNGRTDKIGHPAIEHARRVVERLCLKFEIVSVAEIEAAFLHDALEDNPVWNGDLLTLTGVSPEAVKIVEEVSRPTNVTYLAWIEGLAAKGGLDAVKVKSADNDDNREPSRVSALSNNSLLRQRYLPAKGLLDARLQREGLIQVEPEANVDLSGAGAPAAVIAAIRRRPGV